MHALIRVRARFGNSLDHIEGESTRMLIHESHRFRKKATTHTGTELHSTQPRLEVKTLNAKKQHQPSH